MRSSSQQRSLSFDLSDRPELPQTYEKISVKQQKITLRSTPFGKAFLPNATYDVQ